MADTYTEITSSIQETFFGLTLQRLNIDFGIGDSNGNAYTFTLVREDGQIFALRNIDFTNGVAPLYHFLFGNIDIIGALVSWEENIIDINGNSIFTVKLAQYKEIFLGSFTIVEDDEIEAPVLFGNIIKINTILVTDSEFGGVTYTNDPALDEGTTELVGGDGAGDEPFNLGGGGGGGSSSCVADKCTEEETGTSDQEVVGPDIAQIFNLFAGRIFMVGEKQVMFNFLNILSFNLYRIPVDGEELTLLNVIDSYAEDQDFTYHLGFEVVNNVYIISFIKNKGINELSRSSVNFTNVLDALRSAHEGEIMTFKKGHSITEGFSQQYGIESIVLDFFMQDVVTVVRGGLITDFLNFTEVDIIPFFGLSEGGVIVEQPDQDTLERMERILNDEEEAPPANTRISQLMSRWGKEFYVNRRRLTQLLPYTEEQLAAVALEEQAMIDFIVAMLAYFNALPVRQIGDAARDGRAELITFMDAYIIAVPDVIDQAIEDIKNIMNVDNYNNTLSLAAEFNVQINSYTPGYPSVDSISAVIGTKLSLNSTADLLQQREVSVSIPDTTRVLFSCFPVVDHPLMEDSIAQGLLKDGVGRWHSYVQLPSLNNSDSTSSYTWQSAKAILSDGNYFTKVEHFKSGDIYIIRLEDQLVQIQTTADGETSRLTVPTTLSQTFLSSASPNKRYGPFIFLDGKLIDEQSSKYQNALDDPRYRIKNINNNNLIPENFSNKGTLSYTDTYEAMENFVVRNISVFESHVQLLQSFGSVEVAGLPVSLAFDGTIFRDGSFVDRIAINFDVGGIKTVYQVKSKDPKGKSKKRPEKKTIDVPKTPCEEPEPSKMGRGGKAIITGNGGSGSFNVGGYFCELVGATDLGVRRNYDAENTAEWNIGQGHLPIGTFVSLEVYRETECGPDLARFSYPLEVFSPPAEE
jgi:hypothetical protein